MRISDWSSDVCSSDLVSAAGDAALGANRPGAHHDPRTDLRPHRSLDIHHRRARLRFANRPAHHDPAVGSDLRGHPAVRSEEHTSELQSLMRISYAVFCLKKKKKKQNKTYTEHI